MKLPFIILSYGDFNTNKKIFSYEVKGVHSLPIFSDGAVAQLFVRKMNVELENFGDKRFLTINVCGDRNHAYNMFVTIASLSDVVSVIIDPVPPGVLDLNLNDSLLETVQKIVPIDEIIESLQPESLEGGNTEEISKQE